MAVVVLCGEETTLASLTVELLEQALEAAQQGHTVIGVWEAEDVFSPVVQEADGALPDGSFIIPIVALEEALRQVEISNEVAGFCLSESGEVDVVLIGGDLSAEQLALLDSLAALARTIVERVNAGTLSLDRSVVIENHLFAFTGSGYRVFSPDGRIGSTAEKSLGDVDWNVGLFVSDVKKTIDTFTEWLAS